MSDKKKRVLVTVPAVRLDLARGEGYMSESKTETKGKLEKRAEELAKLEMDEEILDVEERIRRRRSGEPVSETSRPKDNLTDKMVDQVIIPLVNRKLAEDDRPRGSDSTVDRALRIAEKAVGRGQPKPGDGGGSALDELDKGIGIFTKIKNLIEVEKQEKDEAGEGTRKEVDTLAELDKTLDLVQKIRDTFPPEGGGGGMSDAMMEFKKWEKTFELETKKADREERLERRRIDKGHDIEIGKLGIEKERNDLLRDGFKRVGRAITIGLGEEDEYDEDEEQAPAKGRGQLLKEKCEVCGAEILIPPEAQVEGKEIKCSECNSSFIWE
ncbi:hypothetical protein ES703_66914 [subsurface metagenome]